LESLKPKVPLPSVFGSMKGRSIGRKRQLIKNCPEVFDYKTILYIGARPERMELIDLFYSMRMEIDVLEVFGENVRRLKILNKNWKIFNEIYHGDVRDLPAPLLGRGQWPGYDVVVFWHGPEHLRRSEIPYVLDELETGANHFVILGMPFGYYPQGKEYGNPHEKHASHLSPEYFQQCE